MPIYEYQCESCGEITEAMQSISDEPLSTCETCSGPVKKLISQSSFQLKGGGWYADGYSSTSNNSSAKPCGDKAASCPAASKSSCGCG